MNDVIFEQLAFAVFKQAVTDYLANPYKFRDAEEYIKKYIDATSLDIDSDVFMQKLKERSRKIV